MSLSKNLFSDIFYFGLILIVVALPLSVFLISLAQFILIGSWLLEGDLKNKLNKFFNNTPALLFTSLMALHIIGLLYTGDFEYGFKDIRVKAPLLILPLLLSTSKPLSEKRLNILLYFFIAAVFTATIISTAVITGLANKEITDIRQASLFISHIRFSLLICVAICILCYKLIQNNQQIKFTIPQILIITWFIYFLFLIQSATGIIVLGILTFIFSLIGIYQSKSKLSKLTLCISLLIIGSISTIYLNKQVKEFYHIKESFNQLPKFTSRGNAYIHYKTDKRIENGYYIGLNTCWIELKSEWPKRSMLDFEGKDLKGQGLKYTLKRYLTSKGLKKDADGVNQLTDEDVRAIEKGSTNYRFVNSSGFSARIYQILWEFDSRENEKPNGHSVIMRLEFWKTALLIIQDDPIMGVGTGDVKQAFEKKYDETNSRLDKEWRLRAHNQFLSITIAFGIIGLLWFLITLFYPLYKKDFSSLYLAFWLIALLSMLTEDTLETSAGVTFFAFFNSFFYFHLTQKKREEVKQNEITPLAVSVKFP